METNTICNVYEIEREGRGEGGSEGSLSYISNICSEWLLRPGSETSISGVVSRGLLYLWSNKGLIPCEVNELPIGWARLCLLTCVCSAGMFSPDHNSSKG